MGIIKALKLGFDYQRYDDDGNVVDMQRAVNDVNLDIKAGEFVAVLGHNGSGKSTLAKHMNALLIPTEGTMLVDGIDTARETKLWKVQPECRNGISESGEPDHRNRCGRGCRIWSGKYGSSYR